MVTDDIAKRMREISSCMVGDYDGEFDNWALWIGRSADRIEALTAENERLRGVLRSIEDQTDTDPETMWIADIASAAVGEKQ